MSGATPKPAEHLPRGGGGPLGSERPVDIPALLAIALTAPGALPPGAAATLARTIADAPLRDASVEDALAALAAALYGRPDQASPLVVDALLGLLQRPDGVVYADMAGAALVALASTDVAAVMWRRLGEVLGSPTLSREATVVLLSVVAEGSMWRPDLLSLPSVLELAATPALAPHRDALLEGPVRRLLFEAPGPFAEDDLPRMDALFAGCRRYRHALEELAARPATRPGVRRAIEARAAAAFPFRPLARTMLASGPFRLLVVHNVRLGQGDDIVRLVPLLQALLDANPELTVTLLANRVYLFDHPRVQARPLADPAAAAALDEAADGVMVVEEPALAEMTPRPDLREAVERRLALSPPVLLIRCDVGYNHFVFRSVRLGAEELVPALGLDWLAAGSVYDPCGRLLAELGLPARVAEDEPLGPSLLTGTPSADAERVWHRLRQQAGGESPARPVALVNAFGGSHRAKGFDGERPAVLARELAGLVDEGHAVILLPNGTPWADAATIEGVLGELDLAHRRHVAIAPDPAATPPPAGLELAERPELSHADRVMRVFKYLARRADLVVTVEGWMMHLAYVLGRPFRLLPTGADFSRRWLPAGRGPGQRVVTTFSTRTAEEVWGRERLGPDDPPPLPHPPRKALLLSALPGLARVEARTALPLLARALRSQDHEVRRAAVAALGAMEPCEEVTAYLLRALRDRAVTVRARAATALEVARVDLGRALGPSYRSVLEAHRAVLRQDWATIRRLGPSALPVLALAMDDEHHVIRREARWVARELLRAARAGPGPASPAGSAGRAGES